MVTAGRAAAATRSPVRAVTLLFGAVFLLVGVAGFIPGVTSHYGDLGFAGEGSEAEILGLFQTSVLHNVVHLLFGVFGVAMARSETAARMYLTAGGSAYLTLWVYGLIVHGHKGNFIPVDNEGNWLHLGLALAMLGFGLLLPAGRPAPARAPPRLP